jgi:hypothetical protein
MEQYTLEPRAAQHHESGIYFAKKLPTLFNVEDCPALAQRVAFFDRESLFIDFAVE